MNSFNNFIWDCYIKSFENADALLEASINLLDEEKVSLMNLSTDSLRVWRNLFENRRNYLLKNVKFKTNGNYYSIDKIEFHSRYGWTIYYNNQVAYFGKSSIFGNLNIKIGRNTYFSGHSTIRGSGSLEIGSYCSIGFNLYLNVANLNHPINYPASIGLFRETRLVENNINIKSESEIINDSNNFMNIGSDVWIGQCVTLFNNINIGHGSVIGAHSLVTNDCEPYGIYVGKPARLLKYRFSKSIIDGLLSLKWWDWSQDKIERNAKFFGTDLTNYTGSLDKLLVN